MAYATEQNIVARYGEAQLLLVADRDGDGIADAGVVDAALDDATDEIDSYLAARYALPLTTVPGILTRIAADLAMMYMSPTADSQTEEQSTRIKEGRDWLKMLAKGVVSLGNAAPEPETIPQAAQSASTNPSRVFTRTTMRGL